MIPADAASLRFAVDVLAGPIQGLFVSVNGQDLPFALIGSYTNVANGYAGILGVDTSAFAGQVATIAFSGFFVLDDIQFSSQSIPEPSAAVLTLIAGGVLPYMYRRYRRKTAL
jgi:hypothetical protein